MNRQAYLKLSSSPRGLNTISAIMDSSVSSVEQPSDNKRDDVVIKIEEFDGSGKVSRRDLQHAFASVPKELLEEMALARTELEDLKSTGASEEALNKAKDRYGLAVSYVKGSMDDSLSERKDKADTGMRSTNGKAQSGFKLC